MTTTGGVLVHYLELAISRSPGFKSIDPDVHAELVDLGAAIDRAVVAGPATDAFMLGALSAIRDRLAAAALEELGAIAAIRDRVTALEARVAALEELET